MPDAITGDREVLKKLEELSKRYPEAMALALYEEGMGVWGPAVKLTPVEFNVLRSSAYVAPPSDPKSPVVEVGFGTDYAIPVHERTELRHPRGGQAKFLEAAVMQRQAGMAERIAARTQANAEAGRGLGALQTAAPTRPSAAGTLRHKRAALAARAARARKKKGR